MIRALILPGLDFRQPCFWPTIVKTCRIQNDVAGSNFFLRTILVTANRFCPPNRFDYQMLQHPQNVMYSRVIQAIVSLSETSRGAKGDLKLSKSTVLWLNLQNAVSALTDGTSKVVY